MAGTPNTDAELEATFWSKADTYGDGCWEWQGGRSNGYGQARWNGKTVRAHRLAWSLSNKREIPEGMVICHHCDNPPCCNPAHLFLGTHADNNRDRDIKGRNGSAVLTEDQAREIHDRHAAGGISHSQLAAEYGVTAAMVGLIAQGKKWSRLWDEVPPPKSAFKLTEAQVLEIRARYAAGGITQTALANDYGMSASAVSKLIRGERWGRLEVAS